MLPRLRFALSPRWLVLHLVTLSLVVAMVLLGRWQLRVSNAKHFDLRNFGYALQWWAFSVFVLGMWARIMLDARGPRTLRGRAAVGPGRAPRSQDAEQPAGAGDVVAYRRYVMPQSTAGPPSDADSEHAAYNDYLARLDAASLKPGRAEGAAS